MWEPRQHLRVVPFQPNFFYTLKLRVEHLTIYLRGPNILSLGPTIVILESGESLPPKNIYKIKSKNIDNVKCCRENSNFLLRTTC